MRNQAVQIFDETGTKLSAYLTQFLPRSGDYVVVNGEIRLVKEIWFVPADACLSVRIVVGGVGRRLVLADVPGSSV